MSYFLHVIGLCICSNIAVVIAFSGSLQFNLLHFAFLKVEGVKFEASFMSERASLFLSSIGLLGEYCPTSRKKNRHSTDKVPCMHLVLLEGCNTDFLSCQFMRPFPAFRNLSGQGKSLVTRTNSASDLRPF